MAKSKGKGRLRRVAKALAVVWLVLLGASHIWRRAAPWTPTLGPWDRSIDVPLWPEFEAAVGRASVPIVLTDVGNPGDPHPVVLLHGSPGARDNFGPLLEALPEGRRYLSVDLPGFGASTRELPDYSIRTQAALLDGMLEQLGLDSVHVLGYSMGGGVALELSQINPDRIKSMTLLSSIGAQELELFGDYHLNHALHGAQLALLWGVHELIPHFGAFDGGVLSVEYARNFFDSDQRPLREALLAWEGPLLILHGREDGLAPFAVALESKRLAPQAELVALDSGHMLVFAQPELLREPLLRFWREVEAGAGTLRSAVDPEALGRARAPFDPAQVPALGGVGLFVFVLLAALATLVSEDLTCVAVGALVGQGRVDLAVGAAACFLGIFVGDMLLFLAGRSFGRRAVRRAPLKWFLTEARVERSSIWFQSKGAWVIFLSRFLPGARLPTYFAAGLLHTSFVWFALWFAVAAGIWTPIVVWISSLLSGSLTERVEFLQDNGIVVLGLTVLFGLIFVRVLVPMASHRGRRLLLGSWRRKTRWEYWPMWLVYAPVVVAALWEGLRQGKLLAFTASNPGLPHAGFVGESKIQIMGSFGDAGGRMPAWEQIQRGADESILLAALGRLQERTPEPWPVVVKPDVGQRGDGVRVVHSPEEVIQAAAALAFDTILQAYVPGSEYGLFWAHHPDQARGSIISVVDKRLPLVRGDGRRSLEDLILDDERAVAMAPFFLDRNQKRLQLVPEADEEVSIGDLGTHCKGALFLDGNHLITPALEQAVGEVAAGFLCTAPEQSASVGLPGFRFGRLDVCADSESALGAGHFQIIEVNGVTSEAAHVYDPRHGPWLGWRTLASQWRLAQRIGAANARAGAPVSTPRALVRSVLAWRKSQVRAEAPEVTD